MIVCGDMTHLRNTPTHFYSLPRTKPVTTEPFFYFSFSYPDRFPFASTVDQLLVHNTAQHDNNVKCANRVKDENNFNIALFNFLNKSLRVPLFTLSKVIR